MTASSLAQQARKLGAGVLGGSGYSGAEILRYLSVHPRVDVRWVSAHSRRGDEVAEVLPNLRGFVQGAFVSEAEAEARIGEVAVVFVALPHNESQAVIPRLAEAHPRVVFIDMGGDFRTNDPAGYARYYGQAHAAPQWLERFVYGLTEFQRERLRGARLIANPGCFATSMLLALAPLARAGRLRGDVCVTGITGSSGSGNKPSATTHHPERFSNVRSYRPLAHQHLLEVEGFLLPLAGAGGGFRLHFVPQSGPFARGIFTTVFTPQVPRRDLERIYEEAYRGEPLISVVAGSPDLRWVQGSPRSFIGVEGDESRGVVFSVLDNLGKGAASQAIQNMNCAMGWPETEGLMLPGGFV
jgi:N-acetyl-gamma-glutamyl-phosphate reductase